MARGRRRFTEEAVTAPVATVLLVIIAIALAVTLTLFGQKLNDDTQDQDTPSISFTTDGNEGPQVQVVQAEPGLDWAQHFRIAGTCNPTLNGMPFPSSEGTPVEGGDVLVCEAGETLTIRSVENYGNALLFSTQF